MDSNGLVGATIDSESGELIHKLIAELFPICRSITGNGFRETLRQLQAIIPVRIHEVPTGTEVFDWTVPREWNIRDAYVMNDRNERVIDFRTNNLHIMSYSIPTHQTMSLAALKRHLFTLPQQPDAIPYRTSYYREAWGFCLTERQLRGLPDGQYEVYIDSSLEDGFLTYGECFLKGDLEDEVLVSCHACHPSLCNDNLSGIGIATYLAASLQAMARKYSYRFLFIPGTIGSITWLSENRNRVSRIKHGLVLTCLGDAGNSTYKRSRRGSATIDRAVAHVLSHSGADYEIADFSPYGYDERQYCSPAFDLPVGCLMRTPHGQFPEYHTSADNLELVRSWALADSLAKCVSTVEILERNGVFVNLNPACEPQLGKRGLYRAIGGQTDERTSELALLWVLNQSDGGPDLLTIADRSGLPFSAIRVAADLLLEHGLLDELHEK